MERRSIRDPDTGESSFVIEGGGLFDSLMNIGSKVASKLTGEIVQKLATKAAEKAIEKGSEKIGEKTGQLVGEKIYDKFSGKKQKQKKEVTFQEPVVEAVHTIIEEPKGDKIIKLLQKENGVKNDKYRYIKDIYNDFLLSKKFFI